MYRCIFPECVGVYNENNGIIYYHICSVHYRMSREKIMSRPFFHEGVDPSRYIECIQTPPQPSIQSQPLQPLESQNPQQNPKNGHKRRAKRQTSGNSNGSISPGSTTTTQAQQMIQTGSPSYNQVFILKQKISQLIKSMTIKKKF